MMNRTVAILVASIATLVAVADTNVAAKVEKPQQAVAANVGVVSSAGMATIDTVIRAELKEAACEAKAEYKDRYDELKVAHDRFMGRVSIWVAILSIVATILGIAAAIIGIGAPILQRKDKQEIDEAKKRLDELEEIATRSKMRRGKDSLAMMKFVWAEFLAQMQGGNSNVNGREIVHPLYRVVEVLWQACEIGDAHFLNESVHEAAKAIEGYGLIAPPGSSTDDLFKAFVKKHRILVDSSSFYNLENSISCKTHSLKTVLKFLNEFGIKMFGEVDG